LTATARVPPVGDWRLPPLLLLPFLAIWMPPLFDLDEGAFTASTTEMFLRGDFLSSYMLGEPRHDKPILIYWLQAASALVFGFNEFALRLPSALAASTWIALTWAFFRRLYDRDTALLAALVIACAAGLVVIQRAATADALLNLWLAAAGYAAWLWLEEDKARWHWLGHAAMALGFLTKGPVALVVPGMAVLLWCASRGEWHRLLRWVFAPGPMLLFFALAAPWFVVLTLREGTGFLYGFFLEHNVARYQEPMEGHGGGYFYYLPVVLLSLLPFTGLLLSALAAPRRLWVDTRVRFGLIWFTFVLVLFSFSGTKLPHYVYYGYAGLLLVLATQARYLESRILAFLPATLLAALLLAFPWLLELLTPRLKPDDQLLAAGLDLVFGPAYWAGFTAALLLSLYLLLNRRVGLVTGLYANGLVLGIGIAALLLPAAGELLQRPVQIAGHIAAARSEPLVMHGINHPSFQTYARRQVHKRPPKLGDLVLTRESRLADLPAGEIIYRERSYVLLRL